jgi:aubergine-like protein
MVYDQKTKTRGRKASCAAIIAQVIRKDTNSMSRVEIYSKTFSRSGGNEYQLGDALKETVAETCRVLNVKPQSVVIWRDGIAESAEHQAKEEINGVRQGLSSVTVGSGEKKQQVPLAYIVCQKRIATKLLTTDGQNGAPPGTQVVGLQSMQFKTFYLNGRAPPNSTPKPVRFICIESDPPMRSVPLASLTWSQCHDYPNWAGPIKVPSCCQMAHKLAELAGGFADGGESINHGAYKNRVHFL